MPKTTFIDSQKKLYASNQAYIQEHTGLNMYDYFNHQLEVGCQFLEETYPRDKYDNYYIHFSQHRGFWDWWEVEFKAFENSFVNYLHSNPVVANEEAYRMKMNEMVYEGFVRASYQDNFLKILDGSIF